MVQDLTYYKSDTEFEEIYLSVRKKESRIYSNPEVASLPNLPHSHQHYYEWQIRKRSMERIIKYISKKNKSFNILEVGCGNGWLSARLSKIPGVKVTGLDINEMELKQAMEVFGEYKNLAFLKGSINNIDTKFDLIILAASVQYFKQLSTLLDKGLSLLTTGGEIHILDTFFYRDHLIPGLKSKQYFTALGFPQMTDHYFHRTYNELNNYHHKFLFKPSMLNTLLRRKTFFPWIKITPE